MGLNEEIFQFWEYFWFSRTVRIAKQGTNSMMIKSIVYQKIKERNLVARSQASGFGELIDTMGKKIVKIISSCLAFLNQQFPKKISQQLYI